jgi:hypothetical protein
VKSKLYPALVLVGISWGAAGSGCGESRRPNHGAPRDPGGSGGGARGSTGGSGGLAGANGGAGSSAGGSGGAPDVAGTGSGASAGAGSAGVSGGGAAGDGGAFGGEGGAPDPVAGVGGSAAGTSGAGGITDAGTDGPTADAFCDETWPTTKGNPAAPPTCEDQAACGGPPNDAGPRAWLKCRKRLGDFQCDYVHVTSVCREGQWACPPEGMLIGECDCFGQTPPDMICTESGWVPVDGGAAGAAG